MKVIFAVSLFLGLAVIAIGGALNSMDRRAKDLEGEKACVEAGGTWKVGFFHHTKCKMPRRRKEQ